ncbi:endothelin-converting enzyme 1-like [Dermacentor andersoni]|uniref:endothelin-converting enzyme 1-like n=1 Tax=Dermacentor andersoni TaxID=34620 RepID=UPI002155C56E|nr:endothelin-converting enzyme 2-like [Dermacentor andersoni]
MPGSRKMLDSSSEKKESNNPTPESTDDYELHQTSKSSEPSTNTSYKVTTSRTKMGKAAHARRASFEVDSRPTSSTSSRISLTGQSVDSRGGTSLTRTDDDRLSHRSDAGFRSSTCCRKGTPHQVSLCFSDPDTLGTTRTKLFESRSLVAHDAHEQRELLFSYVVVALTVLALCAILTAILVLAVPTDLHNTVCTTAACTALDSLLAASVDKTRDPCVNFYAHVCSGWAQTQNQSVYRSHLEEFLAHVHWIFQRVHVPSQAQTAQQMVAAFYQTCTAVLVDGTNELSAFRHHLRMAGVTWPHMSAEPDLITTVASVYAAFQVTAMLRVRLSRRNASNVLEVAPDMAFLRGWQATRQQLIHAGAYARFFEQTKTKYAGHEKPANSALSYEMFVKVEDTVLEALLAHRGQSGDEVQISPIDRLAQITRHVPTTTWRMVVDKLGLPDSVLVFIVNLELIKEVDELFATLGEQRLHYYLGWCVVQQMMRYIGKDLASSWHDYEGTRAGTSMASEWRARAECMHLSEKLVGQFTFGSFISRETAAEDFTYVSSMVRAISGQLIHVKRSGSESVHSDQLTVDEADFHVEFHEATMRVVDEALANHGLSNRSSLLSNWMDITAAVGSINTTFRDRIPTTYTRDLVAKQRYDLYDYRSGTLTLPPFFAMLPVYTRHLTDTANFGALGTLFATAIFRLFVAKLARYLPSIKFDEDLRRLPCFSELAVHTRDYIEVYYHAASIRLALMALRSLPKKDHQRLRMFDRDRLFFVLMCYLLCTSNTSEDTIYAETVCNEAAKNSLEFSVAFRCSRGALMNPWERCNL